MVPHMYARKSVIEPIVIVEWIYWSIQREGMYYVAMITAYRPSLITDELIYMAATRALSMKLPGFTV